MSVDSTAPMAADPLSEEEQASFSPATLRYAVEVLSGPEQGLIQPIDGDLIAGTGPDADLKLTEATVSRRHAVLERRAEGVWVRDLASKNGTFLSGSKVEGFLIRREALFSLGSVLLRVAGAPLQAATRTAFGSALGKSPPMQALFATLERVSPTLSNVLLMGETGTGKEVLARALHAASPRKHRPFVVIDCGALAATLVESELFGHVRGAFTGAEGSRDGAFATATGGTIFLDEVGELPLDVQPRLLRVLESRTVRRVGEDVARPVDVRVIAATHRDLEEHVKTGRFREDLYFRLAVVVAQVPPLRDRREDIPLLTQAILASLGRPDLELSGALMAELERHAWPGNVRELRNLIERAVSVGPEGLATLREAAPASEESLPWKEAKERLLEQFTREYFTRLYEKSGRNVAELARMAGIARTYAYDVLKKYALI
jgi:two-component system response regulator GlrR